MKGIDVSTFQGSIDWNKVKADGIEFAIVRASYGWQDTVNQVDKRFHENMKGAQAAGIYVGAYHYSYATTPEEARMEADFFLDTIRGYRFDYPVAFDMEDKTQQNLGREVIASIINAFCERVESAGYYVMLYTNLDWIRYRLEPQLLERYDLWFAQWGVAAPTYSGPIGIWQYGTGSVDGIAVRVDMNEDMGRRNYPEYMRNNGINGWGAPEPPPTPEPVGIQAGDTVHYAGRLYGTSDGDAPGLTVDGIFEVIRVLPGKKCGVLLPAGWVPEDECTVVDAVSPPTPTPENVKAGDKVRYAGRLYGTSDGDAPGLTVDGIFAVIRVLPGKKCGVLLPAGWVPEDECTVVG